MVVSMRKESLSLSISTSESSTSSSLPVAPVMFKLKHIQQLDAGLFVFQTTRRYKKLFKEHRNMVVLRHSAREITIINPVRLDAKGEQELESFGNVGHIFRLGGFPDDLPEIMETDVYYLKRYPGAHLWACSAYSLSQGLLDEDKPAPLPKMQVFTFRDTVRPETALLLQRQSGNILITSDVLQSQKYNRFINMPTRTAMKLGGFLESAIVVSPAWLKAMSPKRGALRDEFERLLKLNFTKLIGGSGNLVVAHAKEEVVMAVEIAFPMWD